MNVTTAIEILKTFTALSKVFPRRKAFPVLVVDDDEHFTEPFADLLSEMKIKCETVHSIEAARVAVRHSHYSIIFLDINFPPDPLAGVHFFNEFKTRRPGLKIVFLSGAFCSLDLVKEGHTVLCINKNLNRDSMRAAIIEAQSVNGGINATPQEFYWVGLAYGLACLIAGNYWHELRELITAWLK